MPVPKFDDLFNPLLQALHDLGGSGSVEEIEDTVAKLLNLSDKDINEIHKGSRTKLNYNLAWARTYLKNYGLLENSARGIWALTSQGRQKTSVNKNEVKRYVIALATPRMDEGEEPKQRLEEEPSQEPSWKEKLLDVIKNMPSDAFERLCQRLLRESGFTQVAVTGRTGDGGIDGKGVVKLGDLLSFHVIFQCKRYKGVVGAPVVRDFRGAMVGRADRGLIITTGAFTRDARMEAQRDGAPPLDLIDGEELVEMLKRLSLGVDVQQIENVQIKKEWFDSF